MKYTNDQKVKYTGKGFLGYDETQKEMTIIRKVRNSSRLYFVKYLDMEVVVIAHEIEPLKS